MNREHIDTPASLEQLDAMLAAAWDDLLSRSDFIRAIHERRVDRRLYALYMIQTYHYTLHNARNQALVGVRAMDAETHYLRFCFRHALEETGHEQMALHDLTAMGLAEPDILGADCLASTETLIAYLYWIAATGNPLRRLGYSFWAETSYQYIDPLVTKVRDDLGLPSSQMTFFVAHSAIDEKHAAEVRKLVRRCCVTEGDWQAVARVMVTSLDLTGRMLDETYDEYLKLLEHRSPGYEFLHALAA